MKSVKIKGHPKVYLDGKIDHDTKQRFVLELKEDYCPMTVEIFKNNIKNFKGTKIIPCSDSILFQCKILNEKKPEYERIIRTEKFTMENTQYGLLLMRVYQNELIFNISQGTSKVGDYVIFGRAIEGLEELGTTLKGISGDI